ncbi:hypothetical protein Tco_1076763, partial [Tanacetum coccineum]
TMSSPNHSTSDLEDAFSSMNILNYTSVSSDYFPASSGSGSFNSSENSKDNMIPPVFSPFYNNPCLKDVQAFYVKELPISPSDPITPPAILTPSPVRFAEEVIGEGIGRKRWEAHHHAAMESLMNLAGGAAIENADSDSDLEVVVENISVNHNHLCLGCSIDSKVSGQGKSDLTNLDEQVNDYIFA